MAALFLAVVFVSPLFPHLFYMHRADKCEFEEEKNCYLERVGNSLLYGANIMFLFFIIMVIGCWITESTHPHNYHHHIQIKY